VTTPINGSISVSYWSSTYCDIVSITAIEFTRCQGGPEAVSVTPLRNGAIATTHSDGLTLVFSKRSVHCDFVSITVDELPRFEGGPEKVSAIR
jgi:hypothetical protein